MTGRFSLPRFISILTSFILSICSIPVYAQTPGLVGAYALNESSGITTADASGNANTGTLTNGAVFALGKNGNAVSLDGINDWVNLGANRSFLQNVSAATLSAWVRPMAFGGNNEIIAISVNKTTPTAFSRAAIYFVNGRLVAGGRSNDAETAQVVTTVNTFASNTWYHVAAVINYANDTITVYVNGVAQSTTGTPAFSGTTTSNTVSTSSAIGGEDDGSGNFFNGLIDDVRIYNRALSQSEIQADMNTPVGGGAVNTAPTISSIAAQATNEDTATAAIGFTVGDAETAAGSLTVSGISSNTTVVPNGNIVFGGSGANRTVTVTPAANQNGIANITVTVSDGALSTPRSFQLTVNAVNDAPTITSIANQATAAGTAVGPLNFTVGDVETAASSLTVSGSSNNTALVPNGNIVFGGSGANRTVTVTPAASQTGVANITVTASDGGLSTPTIFQLTVNANNTAPTISSIAAQATNEDTATAAIGFTVGDAETAAGSLTVSGISSNTTVVPNGNIVFGGSGANRTVTVTPAANQNGIANITVTVSDGALSTPRSFQLTVNAVNDAPTITSIANQATAAGTAVGPLNFTVGDVETAASSLTVSGSSNNTALVPNGNIVFGGSAANRTVTVTPAASQTGVANITVTASDGGLSTPTIFQLTVNAASAGLVAAYGFEENGGTTAGDGSGNGHAATLFGGTAWVAGHSGSGLSFDGINDFGTAPTVPYMPNWTISAWVRSPAAPSANVPSGPVHREANFQLNWDHSITSYRNTAMVNVAGAWHPASFGTLAANTWYFLAATYNGDVLNAYTNGVLVSSNSAPTGPAATDPNPLTFGKHAANPQFFRGTIDDVRVYNRALSLAEIQADMNTPIGGAPPPDTIPPSILMSAPANGSKLSGTSVTVSATASDNRGVAGVQFLLDGANLGAEDVTSPYAITWNSTTATNGTHTLSGRARDSAGNLTTSAPISVIVDNQAPTGTVVINGGAVATNSTASTLTLSATDAHSTVTQMRFSNSGTSFSTAEPYATTKAWTLGATQGTQTVYAQFMDAAGNWSASVTDTILLDTTAPTISAVISSNISNSSATITWTTNEPATSQVEFGLTTSYGQTTVISATPVTSHSVLVSGLAPNTTYNYRARSKDAAGNERIGPNATFKTLAAPDTTPPSTPAGLIATAILQTQVNLSWAASTDNVGVTGYRVFRDSQQIATTSQTTYSNTGLSAGTTYRYAVAAFDAAGNVSATSSPTLVVTTTAGPNTPAYPVKVSANGRYLVDQNDVPFFMNGDSPHAMIGNISEADADLYFANRKALGFNTVSIYLLCASYSLCRADAKTFDGIAPFTTFNDFSTPNETYFARADRILQLAAQYGFLVILDPAETGSWLPVMQQNGVAKSRAFGQYVGQRYASFDNIIWMHGNDYGPPHYALDAANDALVTSIALGIKDFDNRHLHTVLFNTNTNLPPVLSTDNPRWLPIINLNAAYTYQATHDNVLDGYNYSPPMPVFMAETGYEFEGIAVFGTSPQDLRAQAYWTVLSGGIGQLFGNSYIWPFRLGWQSQLNTPGAIQTGYFAALFKPRRWYDLVPDQTHTVVTAGIGTFGMPDYVTAARTPDGKLVMAYIPTIRTITVAMSKISGPVTAQWYDPSNGTYIAIAGSPFANTGTRQFTPPGNTSDGFGDWILVLETP